MCQAKPCHAPVFRANDFPTCVGLKILYSFLIAMLILATLGIILLVPDGRCLIKQYRFRITHCEKGNRDPNILL